MSAQDNGFNGAESAAKLMDDTKSSSEEISKDAQSAAQNIGDAVSRGTAELAGNVSSKLKQAGIDAEPLVKAARERTSDLGTALIDEIKYRPLQAVMVAALAGLVVGVLTSR